MINLSIGIKSGHTDLLYAHNKSGIVLFLVQQNLMNGTLKHWLPNGIGKCIYELWHSSKLKLVCFEFYIKMLHGSDLYISHFIIQNIKIYVYKRFSSNSFFQCFDFHQENILFHEYMAAESLVTDTVVLWNWLWPCRPCKRVSDTPPSPWIALPTLWRVLVLS